MPGQRDGATLQRTGDRHREAAGNPEFLDARPEFPQRLDEGSEGTGAELTAAVQDAAPGEQREGGQDEARRGAGLAGVQVDPTAGAELRAAVPGAPLR
ncbi:hypothetical protein GCM10027519_16210 [Kineococcus endophyticus]